MISRATLFKAGFASRWTYSSGEGFGEYEIKSLLLKHPPSSSPDSAVVQPYESPSSR